MLEAPTSGELLAAATMLAERVAKLENALERISDLDVGVWPSWEMGGIARDAIGPSAHRRRDRILRSLPDYY